MIIRFILSGERLEFSGGTVLISDQMETSVGVLKSFTYNLYVLKNFVSINRRSLFRDMLHIFC